MRPTAVARFPCSGIVPLPAALGEYGGGTLMGGLPHMVPHSAVLRPTSDSSGSQLGRVQLTFSVPFHSNNLELREEAGTTYQAKYLHQSDTAALPDLLPTQPRAPTLILLRQKGCRKILPHLYINLTDNGSL